LEQIVLALIQEAEFLGTPLYFLFYVLFIQSSSLNYVYGNHFRTQMEL